jgi:hypothetical protein
MGRRGLAETHGYIYLDQLSVANMDVLYGSGKDGIKAKAKSSTG